MFQTLDYEKICHICELWLVEIFFFEGEGEFFCERCLDLENRGLIYGGRTCHNEIRSTHYHRKKFSQ
jgi:hypothetical protein